jgi:hypothetical protein|tara:strand:- start:6813 stop:7178 length:366 start_codon:yes stop_codon:yes gene_type:complete
MAQSLENKFESKGSVLGYPNNPTQPIAAGVGPSPEAVGSTIHDQYSYDGNPPSNVAAPRYANVGNPTSLPEPTQLQAFTGPQNGRAAGAGFNTYNSQNTYDSFVLSQGATDRIDSSGNTFL